MRTTSDMGCGRSSGIGAIITEAAAAVVAQARKDGLPYITATHDRNNPRSGAVMKKARDAIPVFL